MWGKILFVTVLGYGVYNNSLSIARKVGVIRYSFYKAARAMPGTSSRGGAGLFGETGELHVTDRFSHTTNVCRDVVTRFPARTRTC